MGHDGSVNDEGTGTDGTDGAGVVLSHLDGFGRPCRPSDRTIEAVHRAMGLDRPDDLTATASIVMITGEQGPEVSSGTELHLEDGTTVSLVCTAGPTRSPERRPIVPPDIPIGYHQLIGPNGTARPLLVSPGRCPLPVDLPIWGVTAQLYAARGSRSWGIGDLGDLATLNGWVTRRGGAVVGLNPLHAPTPSPRPPDSPYSPSTRLWRDPSSIDVEAVPGFTALTDAEDLRRHGRSLGDRRDRAGRLLIDRGAVWAAKRAALESVWHQERGRSDPDLERFLRDGGTDLHLWGTYCAVAELMQERGLSPRWTDWPVEFRRPDSTAVSATAADRADRVRFWCWLQWLIDRQLTAAGSDHVVLNDLAVGFASDGFDAWRWQDVTATGVRIGAPPDPLGPDGQDWGLPPFVPWKLSAAGYRPFAETVRAVLTRARGLRVDHVMGLFRLFWLPEGLDAHQGAYVRFHRHDLLHVLAIESTRAGAVVVGEDLGTVEPGIRDVLGEAGVLSTRLLWFEEQPPSQWPAQAMAAVTTHDLPTVAGVWSGVDLDDRRAAGLAVPPEGDEGFRHRLRVAASCDDRARLDDVVVSAYRQIAASPCQIATAALDDLTGAVHRPNIPGTIDEHPDWRIPLPVPVDQLEGHPLAEQVAVAMADGRSLRP